MGVYAENIKMNSIPSSQHMQFRCEDHPDNVLRRFCTTCTKSACKDCDHFRSCYTSKHDIRPMNIAVDAFNKNLTEMITLADGVKQKLEDILDLIVRDEGEFQLHVHYLKELVESHAEAIFKRVREQSNQLMIDIDIICKQKEKANQSHLNQLESHKMKLLYLNTSAIELKDNPENKNILDNYKSDVEGVEQDINIMKDKFLSYANNLIPEFEENTELEDTLSKGLGKITCVDNRYIISRYDRAIIVTKGQPFTVKVDNLNECHTCTLTATLIKPSRDTIAIDDRIEYMESGSYRIQGRCNEEGAWKMEITNGVIGIKGSPVKITVEPTLVHTIGNIETFKINKRWKVTGVQLDEDGCILVSSNCNELLKFNESGIFIANIHIPSVQVYKIHKMKTKHIMFSDAVGRKVVMCNNGFKVVTKFGKGILKFPAGLAVNNERRVLYVADKDAHCVFQFNIDNGNLMDEIGLNKLCTPYDVTLTREGNLLVPECRTNTIQLFSAKGAFMKIIVKAGKEDGKVWNPVCIVMDKDENMIVASYHKLQLFDKNGIFIKRIDDVTDNINIPAGITVISYNPRRLAVANCGENNVKIFKY